MLLSRFSTFRLHEDFSMKKCWICEREYGSVYCPKCGPPWANLCGPSPWGPAAAELKRKMTDKEYAEWKATNGSWLRGT